MARRTVTDQSQIPASPHLAPPQQRGTALEWLETDGLGGFAMGTVSGIRTRRYHGLLDAATDQPAGRTVQVNGFDAWVETPHGRFAITSQRYTPDVVAPLSDAVIETFDFQPWPRWRLRLPDDTRIEHQLFMSHSAPIVTTTWRLIEPLPNARLFVRPFLSGRDYHALHRKNERFSFDAAIADDRVSWRPYPSLPSISTCSNGVYRHDPHWYRNFVYTDERDRGFDSLEDLASPGVFEFDLAMREATWTVSAAHQDTASPPNCLSVAHQTHGLREAERARRAAFASSRHRAADSYIVKRGDGKTIIAGYPWFADWGRDTFVAMRGLCMAMGRLDDARQILLAWAGTVSEGMVPNRFPDSSSGGATEAEYNSVDASLWFIIAVHEFLAASDIEGFALSIRERDTLRSAVLDILHGYAIGTRYSIRVDEEDGLLMAGEVGQQLTWMDARVNNREITPRIGKPVEVQALWLNALWIGGQLADRWRQGYEIGCQSFGEKFWNHERRCLFDVIDADHQVGKVDATLRPNQILAVGGLPVPLLEGDRARSVVKIMERELWTPLGLRSLARFEPGYCPRYEGTHTQRDGAYHQGTVWPWLIGPFVEAWVNVHGGTAQARREARDRFIKPLLGHLPGLSNGHVPEIADAEPSVNGVYTPRGCPFQAWSVSELLRLEHSVLLDRTPALSSATIEPVSGSTSRRAYRNRMPSVT
jgi:predicted glycogen debranching enzyme